MENNLDLQNTVLKKETKQLFSIISNKFKEIGDTLESRNIVFEDKERLIISINGRQQITSIIISDTFYNSLKINELIEYLLKTINHSIKGSFRINMEEFIKVDYKNEFDEVISKETPIIKTSVEKYIKGLENTKQLLNTIVITRQSKSKLITITMVGTKKIKTLEINPILFTKENKAKIEEELIELINEVTTEIDQEASKSIEGIKKELINT